jgi:hypothetical protein
MIEMLRYLLASLGSRLQYAREAAWAAGFTAADFMVAAS